jgi:phosphoglycerate dehydrogenase-like enzyme
MPEIGTVLATVGFGGDEMQALRDAFRPAMFLAVRPGDGLALAEALAVADVAVIPGDVDRRFLSAPNLRWVHCDKAGLDGSARPEVFDRGLLVTGSSGRSDAALAEHVLYFMLALACRSGDLHDAQRARRWGVAGAGEARALSGRTVGILGMGHIGAAVAVRCKALGMHVLGFRRRVAPPPEGVDRVYAVANGETAAPILAECDFLVLALPLTDVTHGLIGGAELSRMKPTAALVNIARGALVDETALAAALRAGRLAGAGLDVFSAEPLPRGSPLWRTPNTIVTPHVTPRLADRAGRSIAIIAENARRYRAGEPLENLLTRADIYTRGEPPEASPLHRLAPPPLRRIYRALRSALRSSAT